MQHGLYLYGIFPHPGPQNLELQGLDQQPVQAQTIDQFVFLYSQAQQQQYLASRKNLLGHEKVLEQAMHAGHRALLPLQFGMVIEDWQKVKQTLVEPHGPQLQDLLAQLQGRREVGVKVLWDADVELQLLLQENQALKAQRDRLGGRQLSMDEVIQIGQAIEQAMTARQESMIQRIRDRLNPLAIAAVENNLLSEAMIYNAAYLIDWDTEPAMAEQVEAIDQEFGSRLRIRYNNFTAPFNFARLN